MRTSLDGGCSRRSPSDTIINETTQGIELLDRGKETAALTAFRAASLRPQPPSLNLACLKFHIARCLIRMREDERRSDSGDDGEWGAPARRRGDGGDASDPRAYLAESWDLLRRAEREDPDPLPRLRRDFEDFFSFDDEDDDDEESGDDDGDSDGDTDLVYGRSEENSRSGAGAGAGRGGIWGLDERGCRKQSRDLLQTNILHCLLALDIEESGEDPTVPDGMRWATFPEEKVLDEVRASFPPPPFLLADCAQGPPAIPNFLAGRHCEPVIYVKEPS